MKMPQGNSLYKQTKKCLFFKNGKQECEIAPVWRLAPVGVEEDVGKEGIRVNVVEISCIQV
jgi:hypothetical protein